MDVMRYLAACLVLGGGLIACRPAKMTPPAALGEQPSYIDLQDGSTIRIIVPLLKTGPGKPSLAGNRSPDLVGYRVSRYAVRHKVLAFVSAEQTIESVTKAIDSEPDLPFRLPHGRQFTRLIYLERASTADHNMAIVAAPRFTEVESLTTKLKLDPKACVESQRAFCEWVPAWVALRPER